MATLRIRTAEGRLHQAPDLFLSHSSRDKTFVRRLAEDLTFCQVDVWLDEWELQAGDSLHDSIGMALERSRFVAVVLGDHFSDSRWAREELKQALSREKRSDKASVLPLLCGKAEVPPFLEDKLYIDFRVDYYPALVRLAGAVHGLSRFRVEEAIQSVLPSTSSGVISSLRYCGIEPYIVLGEDDFKEIAGVEGTIVAHGRVRFDPDAVASANVSHRIRNLMRKLIEDVWANTADISESSSELERSQSPSAQISLQRRIRGRHSESPPEDM